MDDALACFSIPCNLRALAQPDYHSSFHSCHSFRAKIPHQSMLYSSTPYYLISDNEAREKEGIPSAGVIGVSKGITRGGYYSLLQPAYSCLHQENKCLKKDELLFQEISAHQQELKRKGDLHIRLGTLVTKRTQSAGRRSLPADRGDKVASPPMVVNK
jgi:hypothetical protein